jgi:pyridoxine kinase
MAGQSLLDATTFAGDFVVDAMKVTAQQPDYQNRGVSFEPLLGRIAALLQ